MSEPRRVFRPVALRRHEVAATRTIQPHTIAPRVALCLWVLLALLATGGAIAATARVPVVAQGWVVADAPDNGTDGYAVVLLQPSEAGRLHVGQPVSLEFPGAGRLERNVTAVVPGVLDPAEARRRWASTPVAAIVGASPVVAVLVPLDVTADWGTVANAGRIGRAEVEIGSRSIGSLLPLVGRFFGQSA